MLQRLHVEVVASNGYPIEKDLDSMLTLLMAAPLVAASDVGKMIATKPSATGGGLGADEATAGPLSSCGVASS